MKKNQHFFIVLILLLGALAVSVPLYLAVPGVAKEASVALLPMNLDGWVGRDLAVDERSYEILETRNLVLREYAKGDKKVYLYTIYSQDNRKVSHPPEVCFEGSGVTIVKKSKVPLVLADDVTITANLLVVERAGVLNAVVYWYKAGDVYMHNYLKQQMAIAFNALKFKRTSGALIRLSAEAPSGDPQEAMKDIGEFAKAISAYFSSVMP